MDHSAHVVVDGQQKPYDWHFATAPAPSLVRTDPQNGGEAAQRGVDSKVGRDRFVRNVGFVHDAHVTHMYSGGNGGLFHLLQHVVVQLAVAFHVAL